MAINLAELSTGASFLGGVVGSYLAHFTVAKKAGKADREHRAWTEAALAQLVDSAQWAHRAIRLVVEHLNLHVPEAPSVSNGKAPAWGDEE